MLHDTDLLPVREVAQAVGVSRSLMYAWIRRGHLAARTRADTTGRLVSLAAARVLAAEMQDAMRLRRAALGLGDAPGVLPEYVPSALAAQQVGLPRSTIRGWGKRGKVATKPYRYGRLVRLADVQALAGEGARDGRA